MLSAGTQDVEDLKMELDEVWSCSRFCGYMPAAGANVSRYFKACFRQAVTEIVLQAFGCVIQTEANPTA